MSHSSKNPPDLIIDPVIAVIVLTLLTRAGALPRAGGVECVHAVPGVTQEPTRLQTHVARAAGLEHLGGLRALRVALRHALRDALRPPGDAFLARDCFQENCRDNYSKHLNIRYGHTYRVGH